MITIKCNEKEKEMFEGLFWGMGSDSFNCNKFQDLSCECCPAPCGDIKLEIEYQVKDSNSEVNMDKLVYISGAITGVYNYLDLFKRAENDLKVLGYEVINPAEILSHLPKSTPYEVYMNMSYEMLSTCDYIYTMKGWEESQGAKLELEYAREHNIPILKIVDLEDLDKKKYALNYEELGTKVTLVINPNFVEYSETKEDPIYFEIRREELRDVDSIYTVMTIEQAQWLRDSLGEILDTVEKKQR